MTNTHPHGSTPQGRPVPVEFHHDQSQQTQLLYMEHVIVLKTVGAWTYIEAPEQPMFYNGSWAGYRGYVLTNQLQFVTRKPKPTHSVIVQYTHVLADTADFPLTGWLPNQLIVDVSFGTWFEAAGPQKAGWLPVVVHSTFALGSHSDNATGKTGWVLAAHVAPFVPFSDEATVRKLLPERANSLLGFLYFWGGRSAFNFDLFRAGTQLTGLDCSGLASICYRSLGLVIPRDASKQAMKTYNKGLSSDLRPGDLFFLGTPFSPTNPITHVMMLYSLNPNMLVESADNSTRILPIAEVFGADLPQLVWGQRLTGGHDAGSTLTWGTMYGPDTKQH